MAAGLCVDDGCTLESSGGGLAQGQTLKCSPTARIFSKVPSFSGQSSRVSLAPAASVTSHRWMVTLHVILLLIVKQCPEISCYLPHGKSGSDQGCHGGRLL